MKKLIKNLIAIILIILTVLNINIITYGVHAESVVEGETILYYKGKRCRFFEFNQRGSNLSDADNEFAKLLPTNCKKYYGIPTGLSEHYANSDNDRACKREYREYLLKAAKKKIAEITADCTTDEERVVAITLWYHEMTEDLPSTRNDICPIHSADDCPGFLVELIDGTLAHEIRNCGRLVTIWCFLYQVAGFPTGEVETPGHGAAIVLVNGKWYAKSFIGEGIFLISYTDGNKYFNLSNSTITFYRYSDGTHDHSYTKLVSKTEPTCEKDGSVTYECVDKEGYCKSQSTTTIPHLEHECGNTPDKTCIATENISKFYGFEEATKDMDISIIGGYNYGYGDCTTEQHACEGDKIAIYECKYCHNSVVKVEILEKATGCNWVETSRTKATCYDNGVIYYKCSKCGCEKESVFEQALGHDYKPKVVNKNCEVYSTQEVCSRCSRIKPNSKVESPKKHNFKEISRSTSTTPRPDENGYYSYCNKETTVYYECTECGQKKEDLIKETKHVAGKKDPCTGITKCKNCSTILSQEEGAACVPEVVNSCTGAIRCKNCHKNMGINTEYIKHDYEKTYIAPSCTVGGYNCNKCKNCGHELEKEYVSEPLGHNYEHKCCIVDKIGKYVQCEYACSRCSSGYWLSCADSKHHCYEWVTVKKANYFSEGKKVYRCIGCNSISKTVKINKLVLGTPKVKISNFKGKLKITYSKTDKATGFQIRYKRINSKKWTYKTFTTSKSATKYIKSLKKNKKYQVAARCFTKNSGKRVYSLWTNNKILTIKR